MYGCATLMCSLTDADQKKAARTAIVGRELLMGPAKSQLQWRGLAKGAVQRRKVSPLYWATFAHVSAQGFLKISKVLGHEPRTAATILIVAVLTTCPRLCASIPKAAALIMIRGLLRLIVVAIVVRVLIGRNRFAVVGSFTASGKSYNLANCSVAYGVFCQAELRAHDWTMA